VATSFTQRSSTSKAPQVGQRRSASVMAECVENCGEDRAEHPWLGVDAVVAGDDAGARERMSRYYHVVEAEQVEISEAGVLPVGMQWVRGRWVYVTPHGMLWPRSGDWIVIDQNGRATVLRDEEFERVYVPCSEDATGCRE
jgi:hypothetical protein